MSPVFPVPRPRQAIILAAGPGTRLRPLTDRAPKCLLEIAGETILARQLRQLARAGTQEAALVVGYRQEQVREHVARAAPSGMRIRWIENPDYEKTNTIYSLWLARETLAPASAASEGDVVFFNGDVVCEDGLVEALLSSPAGNVIAVDTSRRGTEEILVFAEGGRVRRIGKEVAAGEFIGLARFHFEFARGLREALERRVEQGEVNLFFESALDDLLRARFEPQLHLLDISPWGAMEVDTEQDLQAARELFGV